MTEKVILIRMTSGGKLLLLLKTKILYEDFDKL